ncbi:hypothetical protein [Nitrosococcus oceani]|uniref:hypothetical protein n=1 Tax=Nitrosococcus oceani TaxID=1229 RepID=UPI001FD613C4|nr:hypothetical protein [Nitrosococcus oceani]
MVVGHHRHRIDHLLVEAGRREGGGVAPLQQHQGVLKIGLGVGAALGILGIDFQNRAFWSRRQGLILDFGCGDAAVKARHGRVQGVNSKGPVKGLSRCSLMQPGVLGPVDARAYPVALTFSRFGSGGLAGAGCRLSAPALGDGFNGLGGRWSRDRRAFHSRLSLS